MNGVDLLQRGSTINHFLNQIQPLYIGVPYARANRPLHTSILDDPSFLICHGLWLARVNNG